MEKVSMMQPEEEKKGDDMSDLFEVDRKDILDTDDVVAVDVEEDILDADEGGSLDSVVTVTDEDIMGDEEYGQSPLEGSDMQKKKKMLQIRKPVFRPVAHPSQIRGLNT